jgi:hypothetical protein
MEAAREQDREGQPLTAAEVRAWFDGEDPVAVIDARLLALVQSVRKLDPELVWDILAILDQNHRRGRLSADDHRRLKGRIERQALMSQDAPVREKTPALVVAVPDRPKAVRADPVDDDVSVPLPSRDAAPPRAAATQWPISQPAPAARSEVAAPRVAPPAPSVPVAPAPVADAPEETAATHFVARPGLVLGGRYVLQREIGEGGISTIWLATDRHRAVSGGAGHVAVKLLRGSFAGRPDAVRGLRHEFDAAQRLAHPSVIRVHDLDVDGPLTFLTMEPLRGELLSEIIRRLAPQPLERSQAWAVIGLLGDALVHAHDRDVIHADVKPGNVMITEAGELRLFDFGAAWQAQREPWIYETPSPRLQAATPTYASAERLSGSVPTTRDDVFSFCCVAYELLTGLHPFDRQPANHAQENRLSASRVPGLTRRQWRALQRGLAFGWDDRPADLRWLLGELGLECSARANLPLSTLRAATPARRGPSLLALAGIGAGAFAAVYVLNGGELPDPARIAAGAGALGNELASLAQRAFAALRGSP